MRGRGPAGRHRFSEHLFSEGREIEPVARAEKSHLANPEETSEPAAEYDGQSPRCERCPYSRKQACGSRRNRVCRRDVCSQTRHRDTPDTSAGSKQCSQRGPVHSGDRDNWCTTWHPQTFSCTHLSRVTPPD